ncbi:MAG TPA: hypothetical protein VN841_11125 [Bryobacteraceae bacterium]|nr:hypothetical protein [Bryobacteraceae bacterium]
MTITLELQPETEASLLAQAQARGLSLDAYLRSIIISQAASAETARALPAFPRDGEDLDRAIDELFDTVEVPPGVGQGAMRRENWYR